MANSSMSPEEMLRAAYAAFNARDADAALALMTPDVAWPRAFKGGFVHGPEEVRAYWAEQWQEIDPHVEPLSFQADGEHGTTAVVHQVVRSREGSLLADQRVLHRFTFASGRIQRMEVCAPPPGSQEA